MTLPAELFDAIMGWAALPCKGENTNPCFLPNPGPGAEDYLAHLPELEFSLWQGGPKLRMPLSTLLLPRSDGSANSTYSYLCMRRTAAMGAKHDGSNRIVFGSAALRAFYIAFVSLEQNKSKAN